MSGSPTLKSIDAKVTNALELINKWGVRMANHGLKIQGLERRMKEQVDPRVAKVEERAEKVDNQINLETNGGSIRSRLRLTEAAVKSVQECFVDVQGIVHKMDRRLDALANQMAGEETHRAQFASKMDKKFDALATQTADIRSMVKDEIAKLQPQSESVEERVSVSVSRGFFDSAPMKAAACFILLAIGGGMGFVGKARLDPEPQIVQTTPIAEPTEQERSVYEWVRQQMANESAQPESPKPRRTIRRNQKPEAIPTPLPEPLSRNSIAVEPFQPERFPSKD